MYALLKNKYLARGLANTLPFFTANSPFGVVEQAEEFFFPKPLVDLGHHHV